MFVWTGMYKSVILILFCCILSASAGSPWHDELSALGKATKPNEEQPRANQIQIDQAMTSIRASLGSKNYMQALTQIHGLIRIEASTTSPGVALTEKIFAELIKQTKEEQARKEKLFRDFAEAMLNAKATKDIDPWLVKLNVEIQKNQTINRHSTYGWSSSASSLIPAHQYRNYWSLNRNYLDHYNQISHLRNHATTALQIAGYWQDYLQHLHNKNLSSAQSQLRYIAGQTTKFTYIPRSKVLSMESALLKKTNNHQNPLTMQDVVKRLKTKESVLALAVEIRGRSSSQMEPSVYALRDSLLSFKYAISYLDSGNIRSGFDKLNSLTDHLLLGDLCKKLHTNYLRTYLKIPDNFTIKDDEPVELWSMRYLTNLAQQKQWRKLHDALKIASQAMSRSSSSSSSPIRADQDATSYLIAGMNYEANEQYLRAIVAYRQAVGKTGSLKLVTQEAGTRLRTLQKAHPTEHAQSQSLRTHDGTSSSFTTSHTLIRKIVQEEVQKALQTKPAKGK